MRLELQPFGMIGRPEMHTAATVPGDDHLAGPRTIQLVETGLGGEDQLLGRM